MMVPIKCAYISFIYGRMPDCNYLIQWDNLSSLPYFWNYTGYKSSKVLQLNEHWREEDLNYSHIYASYNLNTPVYCKPSERKYIVVENIWSTIDEIRAAMCVVASSLSDKCAVWPLWVRPGWGGAELPLLALPFLAPSGVNSSNEPLRLLPRLRLFLLSATLL